ncbi:porphobilinogen synthase [Terricaulis silvestris]|uniref:Delta-aminolevulinic acid dehydratase n=1 Tax=Terricaulis silvestris TaxID=2686094 RepID=A0A6I6MR86_9CAUL|nr:porphobilinogen synthase [Terricaulis silvestris]QGZ95297.1 Delta-aminolevulinic acid dehydratase [Terricaulis silvestris]
MNYTGRYPSSRPRRLRQSDWVRRLTREHRLSVDDLIWAMVVHDGAEDEIPVAAMPGVARYSVRAAAEAAKRAAKLGIPAIAVFPHIDAAKKDATGKEALNKNGLICTAVRAMKDAAPDVGIMVDVALDPFTDHGHDGLLRDGRIVNDDTVKVLTEQALVQVEAGADIVAPSDMMDGRVGAIRTALDAAGKHDTLIMSYAAKYASAFYGPYREAIGSGKLGSGAVANPGDKRTYQMDFANSDEAMREVAMDVAEGADMLLVKPGMPYLDIVARVKQEFGLPTYAFQVSGEYAMIKAAAQNGWIDEDRAIIESLTAFKRAGADGIVTYFAPKAAEMLG